MVITACNVCYSSIFLDKIKAKAFSTMLFKNLQEHISRNLSRKTVLRLHEQFTNTNTCITKKSVSI